MRADEVESLLTNRGRDLLRFAYQLTHERSSAEDLVQEAALRMLRYPATRPITSPFAYARTVMVRLVYDRSSTAAATREELRSDPPDNRDQPDTAADSDGRIVLWDALGHLTQQARTVLVLRFYADFTDRQIADVLGCARGTVRSALSRALTELRQLDLVQTQGDDRERRP